MKKLDWRYEKGIPSVYSSRIILGDSIVELENLSKEIKETDNRFSLLFTSPPYCSLTDYHADQWLRLWLLGDKKHQNQTKRNLKEDLCLKRTIAIYLTQCLATCALDGQEKHYLRQDGP